MAQTTNYKTMSFKTDIVEMRMANRFAKYPSAKYRYTERWSEVDKYKRSHSAASCERMVVEFLNLKGHSAQKVSTQGTHRKGTDYATLGGIIRGKSVYTKGGGTVGASDITSSIFGVKCDFELKYSKGDRQSVKQKQFQERLEGSGGLYFIFVDENHFYEIYQDLMQHELIKLNKQYHENNK